MPHCIVEYSKEIEKFIKPSELAALVHDGTVKSGLFDPREIKTRIIPYQDFIVGSESEFFVNVTFRMLSGRTSVQKKKLTSQVLTKLESIMTPSIVLTVEVRDIDRESYSKAIRD